MIYHKDMSVIPPEYQVWKIIMPNNKHEYSITFSHNKTPEIDNVISLPYGGIYYSYNIVEIDFGDKLVCLERTIGKPTLYFKFIMRLEPQALVFEDENIELYDL